MDFILKLLFPPKCGFCGKLESFLTNNYICPECLNKIKKYCILDEISKNVICIYKYKDIIRKKILEYKFENKAFLYNTFTSCILFEKKVYNFIISYDIITQVPVHLFRWLERGYNHTTLITREISKRTGIKHLNLLSKVKNTKPQITKNYYDRIRDVKGAYKVKDNVKEIIKNKKILLFDDILTTGSTIRECKKELLLNGAQEVGVLTLARAWDDVST